MPRRLRFAPPGYWLHLTQRGNNKQSVFPTDADSGNTSWTSSSNTPRSATRGSPLTP